MSITPPKFSIDEASGHKTKLPADLEERGRMAHESRCRMNEMLCILCDLTDSSVLRTKAKGV